MFGLLSLWCYLFTAIMLPKYFTYSGCTAIFLSLNYLFVTSVYFNIGNLKSKIDNRAMQSVIDDVYSENQEMV